VTAGYSGKPLAKKLGIKEEFTVLVVNGPDEVGRWLEPLPNGVRIGNRFRTAEIVLVFATTTKEMEVGVERAMSVIPRDGTIWLCWPKKASGIKSDLQSRDIMMDFMFPLGLVDVKLAAVSDVWSGHKFVIRKALR